jgi:glycosyltransferase involved in cell wall biosynthesis
LLAGHEDAFVFFDPRDPHDMADAMAATLARCYELTQAQARVHAVLSQRNWQTVAAEYLDVLQEAIARSAWQDEIRLEKPPAEVLSHG